jgi:hypothetical protein
MKIPCPTCKRLGRVPKAFPQGALIAYCGPNGERVPHETCRTCNGEGWIGKDLTDVSELEKLFKDSPDK